MSRSEPRCVLVTGVGRGIGRAITERLAASGYRVYAGVRSEAAGKELAAESERIIPVELDVTRADHVAALDTVIPPTLDALVTNAGRGAAVPVAMKTVLPTRGLAGGAIRRGPESGLPR